MPKLQRFEGPDLEKLLDLVRDEAGPNAAIVEANKLRKGGVGGFFAKETFEVVVDVATAPLPDAAGRPAIGAGTAEPAEPVSSRDTIASHLGWPVEPPRAQSAPEGGEPFRLLSLLDLAERVSTTERAVNSKGSDAAPVAAPTGAFAFSDALATAVRKADPTAPSDAYAFDATSSETRLRAETPGTASTVGAGSAGLRAPVPAAGRAGSGDLPGSDAPAITYVEHGPPDPFDSMVGVDRLRDAARAAGIYGERPGADAAIHATTLGVDPPTSAAAAPVPPTETRPTPGHAEAVFDRAEAEAEHPGLFGGLPIPVRLPAVPTSGQRSREMILHQLSRVGIPAGILHAAGGGAPGESVHVELARILDRFPQAPELPTSRGCLVAVVGPRKAALRLAHHLAQRLDIDPDRVVVAAPGAELLGAGNEIVRSAAEAADGRRAWSRRKRPTVLVLESPIGRQSAEWAAGLLDELEPAMIWGVVEAARKPEDVKAWAAALGGLDAIDLRKLHETTSPASVLQTGIPVGYLDGRPATSARWATLLGRHLSAA